MPITTQAIQVPRKGQVETVVPQDQDELIRLRTELELLHLCADGADDLFAGALDTKVRGYQDLRELNAILRDARDPAVQASIERLDVEFPQLTDLIEHEVIRDEAARIRHDLANHVRTSGVVAAATLADGYAATKVSHQPSKEPSPEPAIVTSEIAMSDEAIENVLENVELNVSALQELVEDAETSQSEDAEPANSVPEAETAPATLPPDDAPTDVAPQPTSDETSKPAESKTPSEAAVADVEAELPVDDEPVEDLLDAAAALAAEAAVIDEEVAEPENQNQTAEVGADTPEAVEEAAPTEQVAETVAEPVAEVAEEAVAPQAFDEDPPAQQPEEVIEEPIAAVADIESAETVESVTEDSEPPSAVEIMPQSDPAPATSHANVPPAEGIDRIQAGLEQVAKFLVTEVSQLMAEACAARDEVLRYQTDSASEHREISRLHAEVVELKSTVAEAVQQAQQARIEAQTARDDAQRARTRAESKADEAEIAADRAQSESQSAQAHAQQARKPALQAN